MRIATFNVNGVNGRLPVLLRWLKGRELDVVCLQELKAPQDRFPEASLEEAGYSAIWSGQKSWNGVAVLARGRRPHRGAARSASATPRMYKAVISKPRSMAC